MITHEVENQAPPRVGVDEYAENVALVEAVARWGRGADASAQGLHEIGELAGSAGFQRDAERANTRTPELRTHDRWGHRVDEVDYDDAYHRVIRSAVGRGAHTGAWAEPGPGANVDRAAAFLLFAQVEPGHACPVSMTHAAVPVVQQAAPGLVDVWMPRLLSREYDPRLIGGPAKPSALVGMAMTEKQGGSDVRANTTRAEPTGDDESWGRRYRLTGHKWFCSAPMSDAFLVLAQAAGGLSCFFVPRVLPDGSRNVFRIQRLKDKLGNRSNASSEVEFDGTDGWLVGDEGRGVATIVQMVTRTRLDCVLGTAAGMRQAVAEAAWHVRHRRAFGSLLVDQPAMTAVVADLALESEAATITAMRLARAYDDDASDVERAFRRLATAVAKYWVCKRGPEHAYEALECLGGNGYTEGFPLARRYREQPLLAIWEGSGNVIALDVLRVLEREPDAFEAFFSVAGEAEGEHPALDLELAEARSVVAEIGRADAATAALRARELAERLALVLQASLLVQHAPPAVADAFVRSRIEGRAGSLYGSFPSGVDLAAILARA
ncbi:putative acyl-CoA dehydrogenase [Agromyces flavus]|uniref:Acyl-CoA dehydrogenase n=1 Tax=Agromyces flavus TaxID=589382 RepID=A0A1H1L604_9MICO|nr:acyl-CoA dehydrogenase family protein [Agromyces flavus]MCP2367445.1 putative acyl-CoA dehydrogenase [Agromyces flavus]GGI45716.1 DNA alkylation response protein [Agromyces flavus]SDR69978.1 putative acyl-CoA dehydrogenase [Agromyces flavus]